MELRRRIDAELAEMSDIPVSSYLMAEKPVEEISVPHGPVASEIEVDSAIGRLLWHAGERLDQSPCFHVNGPDSTLIAVACVPTGRLSVRPGCAWEHLEHLKLTPRPAPPPPRPHRRATAPFTAMWLCGGSPCSDAKVPKPCRVTTGCCHCACGPSPNLTVPMWPAGMAS